MVQAHELMRQSGAGIDEDRSLVPAVHESAGLALTGNPKAQITMAKEASAALMEVANPVIIQGKKYLRFEDWQTVAAFFGITVGCDVVETTMIDEKKGFKAHAIVRRNGETISEAWHVCLREGAWTNRENYALMSMAETRASAKALRNVLAWVAVLGGYASTPAEEMDADKNGKTQRPDEKAVLKRIEGIGNGFELRNWEKKHQAEIKTFSPAIQKKIAAALTKRRVEFMQPAPEQNSQAKPSPEDETWSMILQMANGNEEQAMRVLSRYMKKAGRNVEAVKAFIDLTDEDKNFIRPYVEEDFMAQGGIKEPRMGMGA